MKNRVFLISLSFFILIATVNAQPRFTPQDRLERLKEKLSLTKEQSIKVEKILVKSDEEMNKLRASENPDRAAFRKIMDSSNKEIEKLLNEKQKLEFNKLLEERRNRRQENQSQSTN